MQRAVVLAIILAMFSGPALADKEAPTWAVTTGKLVESCKAKSDACDAYLLGFGDADGAHRAAGAKPFFCATGSTLAQRRTALLLYVEENKVPAEAPAPLTVAQAWNWLFRCGPAQ